MLGLSFKFNRKIDGYLNNPCLQSFEQIGIPYHLNKGHITKPNLKTIRASKLNNAPSLAVVGVTGIVGEEFLKILQQRKFPYSKIKLLDIKQLAGKEIKFNNESHIIEDLSEFSFDDMDIALFNAGESISKQYVPEAVAKDCIVVDNTSAFKMTKGIPLIIPEVNPEDMAKCTIGKGSIIVNPNCAAIMALMGVTPLHKLAKVKRMIVNTYQAASGAGEEAMDELVLQSQELLDGKECTKNVFPYQYAFNLFSHNSPMLKNGYNEEEMKIVNETRKILKDPDIQIAATCIRVPVMRAHSESINLSFENEISEDEALKALEKFPGVSIVNDRENNVFPTPIDATYNDDVYVGRVRRDISQNGNKGLNLFLCGDQIRKGAALNVVQIAELLLEN